MADDALQTAINRAHALLDSKPEWADQRSVNGRLNVGDLRALLLAGERLRRIEDYPGERCESSSESCPCGPVEYHDAEGVPLCAECWDALEQEWFSKPICPVCQGADEDCVTCGGLGRIDPDDDQASAHRLNDPPRTFTPADLAVPPTYGVADGGLFIRYPYEVVWKECGVIPVEYREQINALFANDCSPAPEGVAGG